MVRVLHTAGLGKGGADSAAGRISLEEFLAGGTEGLPSFEGYKDLGRKYQHLHNVS